MTKEQSQILKGIAILMMLFLHLFNRMGNVELCNYVFIIDGTPLIYTLAKSVSNPVPIFIFIAGYGLWLANARRDNNKYRRLAKLMVHYWVITLIFIGLGQFLHPHIYPGSVMAFIENITTYHTTYNEEMWFLLPYLIISVLAPIYFKVIGKCHWLIILPLTFFLYQGQSYALGHYHDIVSNYYLLTIGCNTLNILFYFTIGGLSAKYNVMSRIRECVHNYLRGGALQACAILAITILIVSKCNFNNYLYSFMLIICINELKFPSKLNKALIYLGKESMNVWMIHSWFCYYLFHDFIYSFRYPILIYAVLLIISLLCSKVINYICSPIDKMLSINKAKLII